jgi:hypothetical protein
MAPSRLRAAYAKATGQISGEVNNESRLTKADSTSKCMPGEEDDCPVCYERMLGVPEGQLVWCEECGNALHQQCFQQCAYLFTILTRRSMLIPSGLGARSAAKLTCVYCRHPWPASVTAGPATINQGRYVNLASVAGVDVARDDSTCELVRVHPHHPQMFICLAIDYNGPSRGVRSWQAHSWRDDDDE